MKRTVLLLVSVSVALAAGGCHGCGGGDGSGQTDGGDGGGQVPSDGGAGDGGNTNPGGDGGADAGDGGSGSPGNGINQGDFTLDGGPGNPNGSGVRVTPNGTLTLDSNDVQLHFAWIANNGAGWVSKYDTLTGNEVGRYYSVLPVAGLRPGGANSPSRTALDLNGDVWVANRAPDIQGSVTKILNDVTACPDRNHNGKIDTSRDLNGDGVISPNATDGEMIIPTDPSDINQYDECVVLTTPVGTNSPGVHARGLAVSTSFEALNGEVWVGLWAEKQLMRLDTATGAILTMAGDGGTAIDLPFGPYGLAIDGRKRLWVAAAPGDYGTRSTIAAVDTDTQTVIDPFIQAPSPFGLTRATDGGVKPNPNSSTYGIAIDGKDRVWLAAWNGGANVYRYDRPDNNDAGTWTAFYVGDKVSQIGTHIGRTRGIAADETGLVWISSDLQESTSGSAGSQLIAIYGDDGGVRPFVNDAGTAYDFLDFTDGNTKTAIGVGVDVDGNIWVNNYSGNVVKAQRDTGRFIRLPNQGTGSLYTYSDFTGYQLRHFTAPQGSFRYTFTGCGAGVDTVWQQVVWDAVTPPNTTVKVYVQVANDVAAFSDPSLPQYGPFTVSPANLQGSPAVPTGNYMRVLFVLSSTDHVSTPELRSFHAVWDCPVIFK